MASSPYDLAAVARSPAWLAHRYDPTGDKIHFVHAPRETQRAATFLIDEYLPKADQPFVADRRAALAAATPSAPIHFIFHSAYCCSTLLARAFDVEGVATTLKEPVILNDIQGWQSRGGEPARIAEALDSALALLARPFAAGEQVIVKPSNLINPFAPAMLAMRPEARALLLYAPLRVYLGSIAKKGMWGRLWVRELFVKLGRAGLLDYGFSSEEILRQTDLQIAAIGWLGQHRLFGQLAERYLDRVRTLESEAMLVRPGDSLHALSGLYGLALDKRAARDLAEGDAFTRHSKDGEKFVAADRQAEQRDAAAIHAEEIDKVAVWAEAVAESAGQSLVLPAGLLD